MLKVGVIGLGMIGGGVAVCLARAGLLSAVYDIYPESADKLDGVPACVSSPAALAKICDVVIIAVVSADQIRSALNGEEGLLSAAKPGTVLVIQSTISLTELKSITELAAPAGIKIVDCGVTGGPASHKNGLVSLVGADDETFKYIEPALNGYSKLVAHMGGPGAGMAAKIARNVITYSIWRAGYEGALLAQAAGVDLKKFAEAIESSSENASGPTTWMARDLGIDESIEEKNLREHVWTILDKDLSAALELSGDLDVNLPTAKLSRETAKTILGLQA